ncbi:lamin tail domain-containing protein, partial [Candidatus Roizmanbacteria bacterium]|nr:lamin tail domain-containing protein [Candidatus Roizmanbacteria bacterium]
ATYSGTFDSSKTFAKCPDGNGNWFILNLSTKNTSNQTACQGLTPTPTLTPTLTPTIIPTIGSGDPTPTEIIQTPTTTPTPQSYDNIYISEVMVNPPAGEKEWLEIYNDNDFSVSLNNWYIDDLENAGSSPKIFSLEISGKSYAVFNLTSSMFNNDGDSVRLLDFNKNLKDDFEYLKTETGKTLGRTSLESDDFCLQEPSKNSVNNSCINPTPTIITSVKTGQINLPPTKTSELNNSDVSIHRSINYPTGIIVKNYDNGDVLGITSTTTNNNLLLIRCLTFVSFSYSLLVIISVLIKSKALNKYAMAS